MNVNMSKWNNIFGRHKKQIEKVFVKQTLNDALEGLSKIMLNQNHPSYQITAENTVAIIKKGINSSPAKPIGGIIVFPSSFNRPQNDFLHMIKNFYYHFPNLEGLTIGKYFVGFYYDFTFRERYDESCWCIETLGISSVYLESISTELAKEFEQHSVLISEYADGKIYLYNERKKL